MNNSFLNDTHYPKNKKEKKVRNWDEWKWKKIRLYFLGWIFYGDSGAVRSSFQRSFHPGWCLHCFRAEHDPYNAKYVYVTHAELNAILNYRGGSLDGAKIYVNLFPCNECAKAIIQSGIKTLVYREDKYADTPSVRASKRMLDAAGVRYYQYQATGRNISLDL